MDKTLIAKCIVGVAGCLTVLGATYITKEPECLYGLILVCGMIGFTSEV